jgi:DNA-binding transcriptional LysR family regulator
LEIKQFLYFIEVAKQHSFTKASQNLHVSQPNISRMIKNLEDEVGFTLLDRTSNHIQLTAAGSIVFEEANQVLQILDNLIVKLNDLSNVPRGIIRMGLPPTIGSKFFPKVLADFYKLYPEIKFDFVEYGSKTVAKEVSEGNLDVGVVVPPVNEELFHSVPIIHEEVQLLVHEDHRLAKQSLVQLKELKEEAFMLYREDFTLHGRIIEACKHVGFEPNITYESSQWDLIRGMVANNLGVSLLPQSICGEAASSQIKIIQVTPPIPWCVSIIWRKNQYLSSASREWIQFVCSQFSGNI